MKYPQLVSMPSSVSDWLEEQLEARGIDAVIYARYVLSLLFVDPSDVLCSDQDFQVTHPNKEVKKSGGCKKRFHRSDWHEYTPADVERIKRSAAVECLVSASDHDCGIESLVDELCEKIKEFKTEPSTHTEPPLKLRSEIDKLSPKDLAKKYYEAFPPLSRNSTSPSNLITIIPKWFGSPKNKNKNQGRSVSYDEKLHAKTAADCLKIKNSCKQKLNFSSHNNKDLEHCHNIANSIKRSESMADWNLYMFNDKKVSEVWPDKFGLMQMHSFDYLHTPVKEVLNQNDESTGNDYDNNLNMYDCLPVGIREIFESPILEEESVQKMNLANRQDTGYKIFIDRGLNVKSSIWSDTNASSESVYDNTYNSLLDIRNAEIYLSAKLNAMTIKSDPLTTLWANDVNEENEKNSLAESCKSTIFKSPSTDNAGFNSWHTAPNLEKWSDAEYTEEYMEKFDIHSSLQKLGHIKEKSAFAQVHPKANNPFTGFSRNSSSINLTIQPEPVKKADVENDKDDLLNSDRSHFRPISVKKDELCIGKYVDGTTFVIPSNLEKIDFKTDETGCLYTEDECGLKTKYREFKTKYNFRSAFIPKYKIIENDKVSLTEAESTKHENDYECKNTNSKDDIMKWVEFESLSEDMTKSLECTCYNSDSLAMKTEFSLGNDLVDCPVHFVRPDSVTAELFGHYKTKCDKCNKKMASWNNDWVKSINLDVSYDRQSLEDIWKGEICSACLKLNEKRPPLSQEENQFRQELLQDGDQLLSDLNCFLVNDRNENPNMDTPFDINNMMAAKDIKRRHSTTVFSYNCLLPVVDHFSFASRLEQDCMNNLTSVIPTLRSVTL